MQLIAFPCQTILTSLNFSSGKKVILSELVHAFVATVSCNACKELRLQIRRWI
jgi:hypothetical protein